MTGVGTNYGQALYSLAKEEGCQQEILGQLELLQESFCQQPDFLRLLATPTVSKQERCNILEQFRGKAHPYVINCLKLLVDKGHIRAFSECCEAFRRQYNADNGIICVLAVTAVELTDAQREKLRSKLEQVTGKKVQLKSRIDPACIGGVRLDYDGKRVDGTVSARLDALRKKLENTVL